MRSANHVVRGIVYVGGRGGMVSETDFCCSMEALLVLFCITGFHVYRKIDLDEERS